jgi:hypothetical protein
VCAGSETLLASLQIEITDKISRIKTLSDGTLKLKLQGKVSSY